MLLCCWLQTRIRSLLFPPQNFLLVFLQFCFISTDSLNPFFLWCWNIEELWLWNKFTLPGWNMHQKLLTMNLTWLRATQIFDNKLKPNPSNPGMPLWGAIQSKENMFIGLFWFCCLATSLPLLRSSSACNPGKNEKSLSTGGNKKAMEITIWWW